MQSKQLLAKSDRATAEKALTLFHAKMADRTLRSVPGLQSYQSGDHECDSIELCGVSAKLVKLYKWKVCCQAKSTTEVGCCVEDCIYEGDKLKVCFPTQVCNKKRCWLDICAKAKVTYDCICPGGFRGVIIQIYFKTEGEHPELIHSTAVPVAEGESCVKFAGRVALTWEQCKLLKKGLGSFKLVATNDAKVAVKEISGDLEVKKIDGNYKLERNVDYKYICKDEPVALKNPLSSDYSRDQDDSLSRYLASSPKGLAPDGDKVFSFPLRSGGCDDCGDCHECGDFWSDEKCEDITGEPTDIVCDGQWECCKRRYKNSVTLITCDTNSIRRCQSCITVTCVDIEDELKITKACAQGEADWAIDLVGENPCIIKFPCNKETGGEGIAEYTLTATPTINDHVVDCLEIKGYAKFCVKSTCPSYTKALTKVVFKIKQGSTELKKIVVQPDDLKFGNDVKCLTVPFHAEIKDDISASEICVCAEACFENYCINTCSDDVSHPILSDSKLVIDLGPVCTHIVPETEIPELHLKPYVVQLCKNCNSDILTAKVQYQAEGYVDWTDSITITEGGEFSVRLIAVCNCHQPVPVPAGAKLPAPSLRNDAPSEPCDTCENDTYQCGIYVLKIKGKYTQCDHEEKVITTYVKQTFVAKIIVDQVEPHVTYHSTAQLLGNPRTREIVQKLAGAQSAGQGKSLRARMIQHKSAFFTYGTKEKLTFTSPEALDFVRADFSSEAGIESEENPECVPKAVRDAMCLRINVLNSGQVDTQKLGDLKFARMENYPKQSLRQLNGKTVSFVDKEFEKYLSGEPTSLTSVDKDMIVSVVDLLTEAFETHRGHDNEHLEMHFE